MYRNYDHDDEPETRQVARTTRHIARKARGLALPGDFILASRGFEYTPGGPRVYINHVRLVGHGPGHGPNRMGIGWGNFRGGFAANYPQWADLVTERGSINRKANDMLNEPYKFTEADLDAWTVALDAWEAKWNATWQFRAGYMAYTILTRQVVIDHFRANKAAHKAAARERRALELFRSNLHRAKAGDIIVHPDGHAYRYVRRDVRLTMHSNLEYAGGAGDATARGVFVLTDLRDGSTAELR